MSLTLKYLTINIDIGEYDYYMLTITNTQGFVVSYATVQFNKLVKRTSNILTNKISGNILLDFRKNYILKLLAYKNSSITILATAKIINILKYPANTIISTNLYETPPQTNNLQLNSSIFDNVVTENFYFVNNGSTKLFGKLYFMFSNMRNVTDAIPLQKRNMYGKNMNLVYIKYCNMLVNKYDKNTTKLPTTIMNDFIIDIDNYNNSNILAPCLSYLSAFVESNLSKVNYNNLKQLTKLVNYDALIVRNYAFLSKLYSNLKQGYVPYDGKLVEYIRTQNCIYLKFINDYFVPDSYIERSFREVTFGHRNTHDIFTDARYGPQPKVRLEFYVIIISAKPDSLALSINVDKENWANKGESLFKTMDVSPSNIVDVIIIFNRPIKFGASIVNYLSADITCLIKEHDVIGHII